MRILVEDERKLVQVLSSALKAEHYEVVLAPTGEGGFSQANAESFDLVLLDLMLPGCIDLEILLAYIQQAPKPTTRLVVRSIDGGDARTLATGRGDLWSPAWSPDGTSRSASDGREATRNVSVPGCCATVSRAGAATGARETARSHRSS